MHETTGTGIASWLAGLGLGEYAQIFAEHAIDFDTLPRLSNDDLRELGIRLGHRKPLLAAIAALKQSTAPRTSLGVLPPPDAAVERRQLTVMFCDLVGSTEFSSRLDPEDLRDLILLYQQTCSDIVSRHDGFIAQYRGDGVMIYFGYPFAHEDAAERAVRAALDLVRAFSALDAPDGRELQVRIGLATGLVVVGDIVGKGASEHTAVAGQVPNLAARVQALAEPDTVAIADSTRRLVGGLFEYADLGLQRLKGIDREIRVWQVLGEGDLDVRYDALRSGTADAFVNRDKELAHLVDCWEQARQGRGQVVLLTGEAGIGKSSTLRRLADRVMAPDTFRIRLQCSPRHTDTPLYPLITNLQRAAHFVPGDTAAEKLSKLERILPADSASQGVPLLAALLSIPCDDRYPPLGLPPDQQKALTLKLLVDQLIRLAARRPVLLQFEDAHWIDPTTEEMAWHLVDVLASKHVLVVITARPEYQPGWTDRPHVWWLPLGRLEAPHVHHLIDRVVGGRRLPKHVTQQILLKTDGVPLFVEELTKSVLESGILSGFNDGNVVGDVVIPSTLHDSLMARLDRLGSIKAIAQVGAAIGRRFSFSMLARVTGQPHQEVSDALNKLVAAELIYVRGSPPQAEYAFKHALVQEAAYESLLHLKRRTLHAQIAETIESGFPDLVETEPEALAHHWTRADVPDKAARYWLQAGQRALARSANVEAVRHLANGMRLLDRLSPDIRDWLEFNLQLSLGQASYVVNGPAAPETVKAYARAQELVEAVNDSEQRYSLLYGIFSGYHFAGKPDLAEEPARRALALATRDCDSGHMCQAHRMLGYINFFRGDLDEAREHFTQLACLYDPGRHASLAFRYGADSRTAAQGFHAVMDAISGRPESAITLIESALAYAHKLGHAPTRGWAYAASGFVYFFLQDPHAAMQITTEGAQFCEQNGVGAWGVHCRIFNAWARARLSDAAGCADEIRAATADAAMRTGLGVPVFYGALAEVLLAAGNARDAIRECDTGLGRIDVTNQRVFAPTLHEIRGRCFLALSLPDPAEAAACFRRSIAAAQRSGAKLLELRAAIALARLVPGDDETRQSIAKLYGEFEGVSTPELGQARDIIGLSL